MHLLPLLPASTEGVVYLESSGEKMILLRSGSTMELERCGLGLGLGLGMGSTMELERCPYP